MASCPDCKKGKVLPGKPTGRMVNDAYFAPGPEGNSSRAIILLTDIFGLDLINSKILADIISQRLQCDVWVPDLFNGSISHSDLPDCYADPLAPPGRPPVAVDQMKVPDRVGEKVNMVNLLFHLLPSIPAIFRNRPSVAQPRFIQKLQSEKNYEKLGAVGYCFGGTIAVKMAATTVFRSIVVCHPGSLSEKEIEAIKIPSAWACAEEDIAFKPRIRRRAEEILAERKGKDTFVDYEFKDYKGTVHGFAARPNLEYDEVKAGFEGALEQTIQWFEKTIPV
ncbi:hypothetical protein D9757_003524 [Collybiopsis confluens]|uniref:Dienelactone hydrolase domain-containing protein n=1 Tax=Collybiopsis confluens TaxID=2823264 RepID=A0A8H5HTX2_9AGAR|nr:hypothetical protein D9757_003524 [Collybiopsis confluens]